MGLKQTKTIDAPAATILATQSTVVEAPFDGTVAAVTYTATAAVTGAASPASRTLSLINHGQAGAGTTVVASLALLGSVNLVAYDEKVVPLTGVASSNVVVAGDVLEWRSVAVGGTGLVDPGGSVSVQFERVN